MSTPAREVDAVESGFERRRRLTPMVAFVGAFVTLIGGAAAVAVAQLRASSVAAWAALACSGAAVILTVVSLSLGRRHRR